MGVNVNYLEGIAMEIGQRLRQARLEKGLSQRQLCEDLITRNMLSQIENGSARPSMEVLCTLAARLEKPVSFFLEEAVVVSSNQSVMERAGEAYAHGNMAEALEALEDYRQPDPIFDREWALLGALCCLALAERAAAEDKRPYAQQLLERCAEFGEKTPYFVPALERQRQLLLAKVKKDGALPDIDAELLLYAQAALGCGEVQRAEALLETVADQSSAHWNYLRGLAAMALNQYREGALYLHKAEDAYPEETAERLEICYREVEDYKRAYFYAKKRNGTV